MQLSGEKSEFTNASVLRWNEFVVWRALADVTALRVDTVAVLAGLGIFTFVDVGTVAAGLVQCESLVADATEHAVNVFTLAEDAQVAEHLTLVNI